MDTTRVVGNDVLQILVTEVPTNQYVTGNQSDPFVFGLKNGTYVIGWTSDGQDGSQTGVYARILSSGGALISNEFRVNEFTGSYQGYPRFADLGEGKFLAVFGTYHNDPVGGIAARIFLYDGTPAGNEFKINTHANSNQSWSEVAALNGGGFVATWESYFQDGSELGIYAQRFNKDGSKNGAEFLVNNRTLGDQARPNVAGLDDGGFVITWATDNGTGKGSYNVKARRYNSAGNALADEYNVNNQTVGSGNNVPIVRSNGTGGWIVLWTDSSKGKAGPRIFGRIFDAAGNALYEEFVVAEWVLGTVSAASLTVMPSGNFVATWNSDGQDSSGLGVYAREFNSRGVPVSREYLVNTSIAGNQSAPSVAAGINGDVMYTWQSDNTDGSGYGIIASPIKRHSAICDITFSGSPKEGIGLFTTSINLTAGTQNTGNLAEGAQVWWKVSGITAEDLASGALTGTGTITNGRLDIQQSLKVDADIGEKFEVSVYSDAAKTQQIGTTNSTAVHEAPLVRGNSLYTIVNGPSWTQAEANSVKLGGHLVTINDAGENQFVSDFSSVGLTTKGANFAGYWGRYIGLSDSKTEGTFEWTSGGKVGYENWYPNEPNSYLKDGHAANADYVEIFPIDGLGPYGTFYPGKWNDAYGNGENSTTGIAETPFIRRGDSAYVIVSGPTWEEAEANAVKLGGHLVTINDGAENEWIQSILKAQLVKSAWLGLEYNQTINTWIWQDSQSFGYSSWDQDQPDLRHNIKEYFGVIYTDGIGTGRDPGKWHDSPNDSRIYGVNLGIAEIKLAPNNTPTGTPTVTGTLKVGSTLTIDATTIKDSDNFTGYTPTLKYNWETSTDGTTWSKLTSTDGADNNNTYILTTAEANKKIRGVVSYLDGYGTNEVVNSVVSESIANVTPTYSLTPSTATINEGAVLTSTVTTTNVTTGTKFYYALSGTGITSADFSAGALTGEGITDATGKFSFSHTLANDLTTEGAESLSIKLYSDTARTLQVGTTATVSVVDSSTTAPLVVRGNSLYTIVDGPSWTQAEANSVKLGGHLVTINDAEENEWIANLTTQQSWIGFTDAETEGTWKWVDGSSSTYSDWYLLGSLGAEPNNGSYLQPGQEQYVGGEDYAFLYKITDTNKWGDGFGQHDHGDWLNKGIAETPFIRRGDSAYVIVQGPTWEEAEVNAVKLGGHLVTINDAAEHQWLYDFILPQKPDNMMFIGMNDANDDGSYIWSSGETTTYLNWASGEPSRRSYAGEENYGFILASRSNDSQKGKWFDTTLNGNGGKVPYGIAEIRLAPNSTPTGTPTVTGTFKVGSTLTIDATAIKDSDNFTGYTPTFKYNWETSTDGTTWSKLTTTDGADNNNTYILTAAESSKKIRGVVSYLDGYGTNEVVNSAAVDLKGLMSAEPIKSWTRLLGTSGYDSATSVTTGSDGSIFIAGVTNGKLDGNSNAGSNDAFLSKYNSDGTKSWTQLLGTSAGDSATSVTTGSDGSIYIAGVTNGKLDGNSNAGSNDAFLSKYNSDGTKSWTRLLGSSASDSADSVTTGSDGSIFIAGGTNGKLDGNSNAGNSDDGNSDAFLSKYNSDGTKSWTRLLGTYGYDYATSVTTGSDGSIFIAGITYGNLDGNSNAGGSDAFLSKYNSDGTKSWTRLLGSSKFDSASSISTGSDGSIYIAGYTQGNLDGNSNAGGNTDAFLSKYNSDGTKSWTRLLGSSSEDYASSVTTGSDGSIYITGLTSGNLDGNSNTYQDAFLSKYDSDGIKIWTQLFKTSSGGQASSISTGSDGSIYIAGDTDGNLDGNSNAGGGDAFLSKFSFPASEIPTYTLTPSTTSINEGADLTSTVTTTNVTTGTKFYYALSGTGITTADFSAGALTGEGITDSTGKFTFTHTLANDLTIEGAESLEVKLYSDVARTLQVGSTATVSITDTSLTQVVKDTTPPTVALTTSKASLTAGEQATITFTLSEDSTDFTASDITTSSGGTLSDFKGSGKIYTATLTPKPNTTAASVVAVANKTFSDSAGNFNNDEVEANNKVTFFIDTVVAPGVKITLPGDLTTDENGKSVVIPLVLKTQPTSGVRLDFLLSKGAEASLSTKSLEFSTANWSTPQTLTLKGNEDYVDDIDQKYSLTITGSSTDKSYQTSTDPKGLQIPVVNLINLDDGEDEGKSIYGDAGAQPIKDTLNGTEGPDRIYGKDEDDILYGAAGRDELFGGYGKDVLYGEIGNDELYGENENDTLYGGEGSDRLTGGEGFDKLIGGAGNDTYVIDDERDTIDDQGLDTDIDTVLFRANLTTYTMPASIKNAVLDSGSAFKLIGNGLDNNLKGNDNNNEIDGGDGNDVLNGGGGDDLLKGGSGSDTAHYHKQLPGFTFGAEGGAGITANLLTSKASGTEIGNDTLVAIENIETSDGSDTITGSNSANQLISNGGDDIINANGGDDILIGGQGDDQLDGGEGNDQAVYNGVRDDYEISQDSTGTKVIIKDKRQFQDGIDTITGIETVKFADKSLVLADLTSKTLDFNGDGNVDSFDSILMMRHMMGTYPGESIKKDIPGKFDLTAIQRKLTNAFADTFSLNGGLRLDIDGDKRISAFRDGMMITQHILKQGTSDSPWAPPGFNPPAGFPAQMQQHLKDLIGF